MAEGIRFVLDLELTYEELLTLQASLTSGLAAVKRRLSELDAEGSDREDWEERLAVQQSLVEKLDAYADDPRFVGGKEEA